MPHEPLTSHVQMKNKNYEKLSLQEKGIYHLGRADVLEDLLAAAERGGYTAVLQDLRRLSADVRAELLHVTLKAAR